MDVQQDVSGPRIAADSFPTQWQFTVAGDRFTLRPSLPNGRQPRRPLGRPAARRADPQHDAVGVPGRRRERLLPPESMRFVRVDPVWADCLLDGAFSLGRLTGRLKPVDREQKSTLVDAVPAHPVVSGFLLRSSLVSGWPGLLVDGYDTGPGGQIRGVETLRRDLVAPDVLLCLFTGDVVRVEIHQRPEALHFGPAELPGDWRGADGVVDLDALVGALRTGPAFTSADFAARTVEGVPRVAFVWS